MHMKASSELMGKDHLGTGLATGLAALVFSEPLPSELKTPLDQTAYLPSPPPGTAGVPPASSSSSSLATFVLLARLCLPPLTL